jgi:pimeloyl-ACP methyl ester carboxylesterase
MVVVFTGMKLAFGGAEPAEFAESASARGENSVLFVTDRRATWYAAPGLWWRTLKLIRYLRNSEGLTELVTLGNSMGGYGALLLSRDLRVSRAIAFAPQVTMDPAVLQDDRWPDIKGRYGALPERSVAETIGKGRTQYYMIAGEDCPEDMAHLALVADSPRIHRYVLPGAKHNPARVLKNAGILPDVINALIRGRRGRAEILMGKVLA